MTEKISDNRFDIEEGVKKIRVVLDSRGEVEKSWELPNDVIMDPSEHVILGSEDVGPEVFE